MCGGGGGACVAGGMHGRGWGMGGMHGGGACVAGGMHGRGVCMASMPPPKQILRDMVIWSMSGRYASYWNAFLFIIFLLSNIYGVFAVQVSAW